MKGKWRVTSNIFGDVKKFAVYRLLDVSEVDHSGNREFAGEYVADKSAAEELAERLNKEVTE